MMGPQSLKPEFRNSKQIEPRSILLSWTDYYAKSLFHLVLIQSMRGTKSDPASCNDDRISN